MSIRSESMSYSGRVSPQLSDILRRNGMNAALVVEDDKYKLLVQSHDSPLLEYEITEKQFRALSQGGTNFSNKKAYNTFNSIVGKDFDLPSSFVAARNVNGRVAMGLHGYRESLDEVGYPRMRYNAFGAGFLGWSAPQQDGFHLRRMNGTVMVPDHSDGRLRPGELRSGSYGYYYKGDRDTPERTVSQDPLKNLQAYFVPIATTPRSEAPALSYKDHITSDVYFTNEKFQEVLSSHGIILDADKKMLTIQSSATKQDFFYNLTPEQVEQLKSNSLKESSLQQRIDVINQVIGQDFKDYVTRDALDSTQHISISLKPEVELALDSRQVQVQEQQQVFRDPLLEQRHVSPTLDPEKGYVDGKVLSEDERKGWYREGRHGREVEVGDIWVDKVPSEEKADAKVNEKDNKKDEKNEDKYTYRMSAVINGEVVTHEINQKQYDKFLAVDDHQRMRLVSKVFDEVDMKTRPGQGFNLTAFLAAGLTVAREATFMSADIAHNIDRMNHPRPEPELYSEAHGTGHVYFKPEVDSPQDLAQRAYEAGVNDAMQGRGLGR